MKRRSVLIALGLVGLSACDDSSPKNTSSEGTENKETVSSTAPAEESLTKSFGSTFTWEDGSGITVAEPKVFQPVQFSAKEKADEYVIMEVTLINGTKEPKNPFSWTISATTGDEEATSVIDVEAGIDPPTGDILPGKERRYKVAFGRKKNAEFIVQVRYGFNDSGYYK